jgi:hypothetical protein
MKSQRVLSNKKGCRRLPRITLSLSTVHLHHGFPNCEARPPEGAVGHLGARVFCTRDILILNEIWAQDKVYLLR